MADHVISPAIMELAAKHRPAAGGATLLVDRKIDGVFDLDDATKVRTKDGKIVAIGKQLTDYDCIDTGVFVCTRGLVDAIASVAAERGDASLSEGVQALSARGVMEVLDVGDAHWMDVDTPEMLADAEARLKA
jgi:choline kinase